MKKLLVFISIFTLLLALMPEMAAAQTKRRPAKGASSKAKKAAAEKAAEEARLAEETRKAEEARLAEEAKKAEEESRRQALALEYKKIELQVADGDLTGIGDRIDTLVKQYPTWSEGYMLGSNASLTINDYVASEFYLKKAIENAPDAESKNKYELLLLDVNNKREKQVETIVANVDKLIDRLNYPEAVEAMKAIDKVTLYNQKAYILRGGLLGVYRRYDEAAKIYNRVLEDPKLDVFVKTEITALRDYMVTKITSTSALSDSAARSCSFCKARISQRESYCHVCGGFQHKISTIKSKNVTTTFGWKDDLESVSYRFYDSHSGGNAARSIFGIVAAVSGTPNEVMERDPDVINRTFSFSFESGIPKGVAFSSDSSIGGSTSSLFQTIGNQGSVTRSARKEASVEAAKMDDNLVYASHPKIDATFAVMAFKQNIYRGFAPNLSFDPFNWQEPHIFALFYDQNTRLIRAVDTYEFSSSANEARHLVVEGRKNFTGENRRDPLNESDYVTFVYNDDGLISKIAVVRNGVEAAWREMSYGPNGIIEERKYFGSSTASKTDGKGKVVVKPYSTTTFLWSGNNITSARTVQKGTPEINIFFQ